MFWLYLGLVGFAVVVMMPATLLRPVAAAPAALGAWLVINLPIAVAVIALIRRRDLFEKGPIPLMAAALVWGGAIGEFAISPNAAIEELTVKFGGSEFANAWSAAIAGSTTEELLKGLGVVAVIVIGRAYVRRPMDGLVYGAMCGLGFGIVENLTYAADSALADPNSDLSAATVVVATRAVLGLAGGHAIWSAIVGLGIGYAVTMTDRPLPRRLLVAAALFAGGWGLHFLWNSPILDGWVVVKMAVGIVFFALVYRYGARREFDWFVSTMWNEPSDVITAEEVEALRTLRTRRVARRLARKRFGRHCGTLVRQLHQKQLAVAVARSNSTDPDHDPAVEQARQDVRLVRAALATSLRC